MSPVWDSDRMVNRRGRSVSPSSDRDRIVHLKSNFSPEKELFGRNYRTSPNRRYKSQEKDRYSDSSQNGNFTQNHPSYHLCRAESPRRERCGERYTPERSYRNNDYDVLYERGKHERGQSAHSKHYNDTCWDRHVVKCQSYGRRRQDNYYDDSDNLDDVNSREGHMYIDRRDKPLVRTLYGGRTVDNGKDPSVHRSTDSESTASDWSTDETRQLEDGEIRSPSRDRIGNASFKQERLDLSPVSNESNNNPFDQYYDSDTNRSYTTTYEEASMSMMEDENEYLVTLQPDAFAKKYTLTLDTLELLKTLTDELKQEIAADIMSILISARTHLPIEALCDKLKEKNIFFELITLEKFLEGKFKIKEAKVRLSSDIPSGTKLVVPFTNIRLCMRHSNDGGQRKCNCNDLHICKFYLLSTCPNGDTCKFGHKLKTEHNIRVSKLHFLHRLTLKQIKNFICQTENRNRTTTPEICKFYNTERGCKHETGFDSRSMCQYLNICRFHISSSCKFGTRCKRSHDLFSGQPRKVLSSYGLGPELGGQCTQKDIVAMLNRITNSSDEVTTTQSKDLQMQADLLVNDTKRIDGKLAMHRSNEENFIPLLAPDQDRYFSQRLSDSTLYSNICDSSLDINGNSTAVSSEEKADYESNADVSKTLSSLEQTKTNDLKSRKRNLTVDTDESPDRAKVPKLTDIDENSGTTMASLSLQTKELPKGLDYIVLDNIKKEISSEPGANIDVNTVKIKTCLQKKEQELGTIVKANVDTIKTEISSKTKEFPGVMENVDICTSKTEMFSPTNDMGISQTEMSSPTNDTSKTEISLPTNDMSTSKREMSSAMNDMGSSKTETSSAMNESPSVMENDDADTISMKISFQAKEVFETLRNNDVDTSATEIPLQTRNPPDHCMATECDNKPCYYSVDVWRQPDPVKLNSEQNVFTSKTGGSEQVQATSSMTADQDANDTELHYQCSLPSPSEIKRKESADIKEETDSELVGQEQNLGEGDANRKGGKNLVRFRYSRSNMESYEVFRLS